MKEVDSQRQRIVVIEMECSGEVPGVVIQLGWMIGLVENLFARCFENYATRLETEPGAPPEGYR